MAKSPSSSVEQARRVVAQRLRELMLDAGLTARGIATRAGWHESKSSRLLNGVTTPADSDIRIWCRLCEADDHADGLIAAARNADSMYVSWKRLHRAGMERAQTERVPLYQRTRLFRVYSSSVVPGMLQTADYATALLRSITHFRGIPDDAAEAAAARLDRSRVIHEGNHRFALLVEEAVLRYRFGDADTMAGQLGQLLTAMKLPRVSLGVIPFGAPRVGMWPVEAFYCFDEDLVNVELLAAMVAVRTPEEIAVYLKAFAELSEIAVYGAKARALITSAMDALG